MWFQTFCFNPNTQAVRHDTPDLWRDPTPEELEMWAFRHADDWVLRGASEKPSMPKRPMYYRNTHDATNLK